MTETFATPDEYAFQGQASDIPTSFGEQEMMRAGRAFFGTARELYHGIQRTIAGGDPRELDMLGQPVEDSRMRDPRADVPEMSRAEADAQLKQDGLENHVKLPPGQEKIRKTVFDLMRQSGRERARYEAILSRGPNWWLPDALGFITEMGVGIIDPVNIAAFSIPVVGEARMGMMLGWAGQSLARRGVVKAGVGGAQGAVGGTLLAPADWWLKTNDGQDYTYADALHSVMLSAGMGAAFHAGGGFIGDIRARRRGLPLSGSPEDVLARALARSAEREAKAVPPEVISPTVAAAADRAAALGADIEINGRQWPHPAEVLADLPPRVQEDVVRAASADIINGTPVRVGELLQEAAKEDPRIAESIEAWHGSAHEFETFDISRIGTGQGAQSYGHGLYFAENPKVAGSYKFEGGEARVLGRPYDVENPIHRAVIEVDKFGSREKALVEAKRLRENDPGSYWDDVVSILESPKPLPALEGSANLYRVEINAKRERFLDWDKPLDEQADFIKDALLNHPDPSVSGTAAKWGHDIPAMLERLRQRIDPGKYDSPAAAVSGLLREVGIPGIKYLDQGSRPLTTEMNQVIAHLNDAKARLQSAQERGWDTRKLETEVKSWETTKAHLEGETQQTRNYVVFDDKLVRITHKNGEEVAPDELKAALATAHAAQREALGGYRGTVERPTPEPVKALEVPAAPKPKTYEEFTKDAPKVEIKPLDADDPRVRNIVENGDSLVAELKRSFPALSKKLDDALSPMRAANDNIKIEDAVDDLDRALTFVENNGGVSDALSRLGEMVDNLIDVMDNPLQQQLTHTANLRSHYNFYLEEFNHIVAEKWRTHTPREGMIASLESPYEEGPGGRSTNEMFKYAERMAYEDGAKVLRERQAAEHPAAPEPPTIEIKPKTHRGARARPPETWSLLQYIADKGGISASDPLVGDVRQIFGGKNPLIPGWGPLIRKDGIPLDRLREMAVGQQYLFDIGDTTGREAKTTVDTLLQAIAEEERGNKVYRQGVEPPKSNADLAHEAEIYRNQIEAEIDAQAKEQGGSLTDAERARAVEIMAKEGVYDPAQAIEQVIMEDYYGGKSGEPGEAAGAVGPIPVEPGAAPHAGEGLAAEGQRPAGGDPRYAGAGDREAPIAAGAEPARADWSRLNRIRQEEDPDLTAASHQADHQTPPESVDPVKAPSAAEKAASEADQLLADILPTLSEEERAAFTAALDKAAADRQAQESLIRESAACLAAASVKL